MPHEAKDYKERLGKKVKDMTAEQKREYGRLRVKDHRAKKKSAKVAPKKKIKLMNDGKIPNSKMKCFMRTAINRDQRAKENCRMCLLTKINFIEEMRKRKETRIKRNKVFPMSI